MFSLRNKKNYLRIILSYPSYLELCMGPKHNVVFVEKLELTCFELGIIDVYKNLLSRCWSGQIIV